MITIASVSRTRRDLAGQRFGRLLAIRRVPAPGKSRWQCRCDCGEMIVASANNLRSGRSGSCGCLHRARVGASNAELKRTHGMCGTPTYRTWLSMKQRCHDENTPAYKLYGARGIAVCERWRNSFDAFMADMGARPVGTTIDRINNDGNQEPGNCRWARQVEQERNKTNNRRLNFDGKERPLAEISEMTGVAYHLLHDRIVRRGWSLVEALSTPVKR